MTLKEVMMQEVDYSRALLGASRYDFILKYGRDCVAQPLPKRYRRGMPRACFYNARRRALKSKVLRYAEGFGMMPAVPILIHHAWLVDRDDRVIDVTWNLPETHQYFGLVIEKEEQGRWLGENWGGSLLDDWKNHWKFFADYEQHVAVDRGISVH